MGKKEIERKFLVRASAWHPSPTPLHLRQGYLSIDEGCTVRVRVDERQGFLTIKGRTVGHARDEYEYEIPMQDARELLLMCRDSVVEKQRHRIPCGGAIWEVDVFEGVNTGLVVAEIESESEQALAAAVAAKPSFVGRDVTDNPNLYNALLAQRPFTTWSEAERQALLDEGND